MGVKNNMKLHLNLLIPIFLTVVMMLLLPQMLYGHTEGSSHEHPHDPNKSVCALCKDLMDPETHNCPVVAELKKKISQLEAQNNQAEKVNKAKNALSPIPFSGPTADGANYLFGPKHYCPNNCSQMVYNTSDHQQTCRNDGHSGGFLDYYDCHGVYQVSCPQSSEHVSKALFFTCRYCRGTVSSIRPVFCNPAVRPGVKCTPDS